jgi:hypothetical protein
MRYVKCTSKAREMATQPHFGTVTVVQHPPCCWPPSQPQMLGQLEAFWESPHLLSLLPLDVHPPCSSAGRVAPSSRPGPCPWQGSAGGSAAQPTHAQGLSESGAAETSAAPGKQACSEKLVAASVTEHPQLPCNCMLWRCRSTAGV